MSAGTLAAIAATLAAYGLGSVSGALLVGRLRGGVDIRMLGSGNAGGTNALRTQGPWFALGVIVIDLGKGWLAAAWLPLAAARFGASALGLPEACAFAAMLGHVWPLWHGFRGGKGAATLVGALLALSGFAFGFVGLASMVAATALPLYVMAAGVEPIVPLGLFGVAAALLVIHTHRANIVRMRAGTEPRARRLWLLGRGR